MKKILAILVFSTMPMVSHGDTAVTLYSNTTNYLQMKAPTGMSTTYRMVMPLTKGSAAQVLGIASVSGSTVTMAFVTPSGGGGGSSSLAVSTGSATSSVVVSSPTSNIVVDSNTFIGALQGSTTFFLRVNTSSITAQGNSVSIAGLATSTQTIQTQVTNIAVSTGVLSVSTTSLQTQISALGTTYLTNSSATATYLQQSSATATYLQKNVVTAVQPILYNSATGVFSATLISATTGMTGTIQANQFPALTGDITTSAGSLATTAAAIQANIKTFTSSITVTNVGGIKNTYGIITGTVTADTTNLSIGPAINGTASFGATGVVGVKGTATSASSVGTARGGEFSCTGSNSGGCFGVYGGGTSANGGAGVYGEYTGSIQTTVHGVRGVATTTRSVGASSSINYGVKGEAGNASNIAGSGVTTNYALHGAATGVTGSGNAVNYGAFLTASGAGSNYGLWVDAGQVIILSSTTFSSPSGTFSLYNISAGSLTARNVTSALVATDSTGVLISTTADLGASNIGGNLPVARLNSGTGASATTFWRGDATWATPAGGGGGASTLALTTGTAAGFSSIASSPTAVINFNSALFTAALAGSATGYVSLVLSSVTALGSDIDVSGAEISGILKATAFPALTGDITTSAGALATTAAGLQANIKTLSASSITVTGASGLLVTGAAGSSTTYSVYGGSLTIRPLTDGASIFQLLGSNGSMMTRMDTSANATNDVVLTVIPPITASFGLGVSTNTGGPYFLSVSTSGHIGSAGTAPALTSCGTSPTVNTNCNDNSCTVTPGATAAGCTITFNKPGTNAPTCVLTEQTLSLVNALSYTVTATAITVTQTALTSKLDYICNFKD